ncbi:ABC transporter permease [Eubacteriales bacterium OttesenSCG-928-G02]|nr:ABC transporter permease [Eubacteriales bacterium OttesenSCG-928-G02]
MIKFTIRNLKVFFKDKSAVFFSLLAVFIIIGLYVLFLGDIWLSNFPDKQYVRLTMDTWIMTGLVAASTITTTMGAFGIIVDDKRRKLTKDFAASPISNTKIIGGYIFSAFLVGLILTLVTLVLAELYIISNGGTFLPPLVMLKVFGIIILSCFSNSALVLFLVSFFSSPNAFSAASTVLGTLVGFLMGIYMPIGNLPSAVQWIVKLFPGSHSAVLLRRVAMEEPMRLMFEGAPQELADFKSFMGVEFIFGNTVLPSYISVLILLITGIVFYILSILNFSRKKG